MTKNKVISEISLVLVPQIFLVGLLANIFFYKKALVGNDQRPVGLLSHLWKTENSRPKLLLS